MMDPRLFEAACTGDVSALLELLQEDRLILHNVTLTSSDSPLHIASLLDHIEFARVVMKHNSKLALELNQHGLSPVHVASAKGNLQIVKDFLNFDRKLCLVKDQGGRIPLHWAAIKGKSLVLTELLSSCPESVQERTPNGETILHLVVKNNQFEALVSLVHLIRQLKLEHKLLNCKDNDGNTILHLASARKQSKMVKLLVSETDVDLNAVNSDGLTALDVMVSGPTQSDEKDIDEMLRGSGCKQALNHARRTQAVPPQQVQHRVDDIERSLTRSLSSTSSRSGAQPSAQLIESLKNGIMLLAVMFATLSFEVGLNPPGGLWQDWDADTSPNITAAAVAGVGDGAKSIPYNLFFIPITKWKLSHIPNVSEANEHRPGRAISREFAKRDFLAFMAYDATCFFLSLTLIFMVAVTDTFDFDKYAAIPLLSMTISLIYYATLLFRTGINLVTDNKVTQWAMTGAGFNLVCAQLMMGAFVCLKQIKSRK